MAEILMRGAGGDDKRVVIERTVAEDHAALGCINVDGFAQQHLRVFLFVQNVTQRAGNVRGGKRAGRDLIEQRLEKMIVAAVHQRHPHWRIFQSLRGAEAAETAADDHDLVWISHSSANSSTSTRTQAQLRCNASNLSDART